MFSYKAMLAARLKKLGILFASYKRLHLLSVLIVEQGCTIKHAMVPCLSCTSNKEKSTIGN
jgi:hypothetical protein